MHSIKREVDQLYKTQSVCVCVCVNPKRNHFLLYYVITWNEELTIYYGTDTMHNMHNERQESANMWYEWNNEMFKLKMKQ